MHKCTHVGVMCTRCVYVWGHVYKVCIRVGSCVQGVYTCGVMCTRCVYVWGHVYKVCISVHKCTHVRVMYTRFSLVCISVHM